MGGFFIVMPRVAGGVGVTRLSELIIDVSKDWAGNAIKNLGEPADPGDALRLPWDHASRHAPGGGDPLGNLNRYQVSDFFSSPFWNNIPDRPSTYPPSSHASAHDRGGADPLTSLDAGVITSGVLNLGRLPSIPPSKLDAVDTPAGGEVPSYNAAAGKFEWVPAGGEGGGLRSATKIVAASNSLDKTRADYVCDGTADQEEINAAISAISSVGGTVLLLEGTYNITGSVNLASNIALVGQGPGTVLRIPDYFNANLSVIYGSGISRVLVADLRVDGNRAHNMSGTMHGIYLTPVTYSEVRNCWVENMRDFGILLLASSSNNIISGNTCRGNGGHGIHLYSSSNNNIISGNTCLGNVQDGINLFASCNYNTIVGNAFQGNSYHGIHLTSSCNNNVIVGNSVLGNSQYADNTYDGIRVTSNSDYNFISGNMVRHQGLTNQQRYGINVNSSDCGGNLIHGNDLYQAGKTADFNDAGTGTIYHNNRTSEGWVP
jgi:parallel beta-helix repeat protein